MGKSGAPDRPAVIAHRGASAAHRENTLAAFHTAVSMGADGVELDVRRGLDGSLFVHHDPHFEDGRRVCATAAGDAPRHVPVLGVALEACAPALVNVEIKNSPRQPDFDPRRAMVGPVVESIGALAPPGGCVVSSFDIGVIDEVRRCSDLPTAYLVASGPAEAVVGRCVAHGHQILNAVDGLVDEQLMALAESAGVVVNVWTVDAPDRIRELATLGVGAIITNVPDVALAVLR